MTNLLIYQLGMVEYGSVGFFSGDEMETAFDVSFRCAYNLFLAASSFKPIAVTCRRTLLLVLLCLTLV